MNEPHDRNITADSASARADAPREASTEGSHVRADAPLIQRCHSPKRRTARERLLNETTDFVPVALLLRSAGFVDCARPGMV
jgi:hypothetical protein